MLQQKKGWGKNVIVMYTCKDNLTPWLYSGKIKKIKKKTPLRPPDKSSIGLRLNGARLLTSNLDRKRGGESHCGTMGLAAFGSPETGLEPNPSQ